MRARWICRFGFGLVASFLVACGGESAEGELGSEPGKVAKENVLGPEGERGVCCVADKPTSGCYNILEGGWARRGNECSGRTAISDVPCTLDTDVYGCSVVRVAPELCEVPGASCQFGRDRDAGDVADGSRPDGGYSGDAGVDGALM